MTVKELRDILATMPDDAPIVITAMMDWDSHATIEATEAKLGVEEICVNWESGAYVTETCVHID